MIGRGEVISLSDKQATIRRFGRPELTYPRWQVQEAVALWELINPDHPPTREKRRTIGFVRKHAGFGGKVALVEASYR